MVADDAAQQFPKQPHIVAKRLMGILTRSCRHEIYTNAFHKPAAAAIAAPVPTTTNPTSA
jgi:hypothetical protein